MSMKILIAEDDRISRLLIQRILEADSSHSLTMVNDGEEAWDQLNSSSEPFDVCLLDIMMPRLDGLGLITRMRNTYRFKATPVILCTALNDRNTVQRAALLSVSQYIVKPSRGKRRGEDPPDQQQPHRRARNRGQRCRLRAPWRGPGHVPDIAGESGAGHERMARTSSNDEEPFRQQAVLVKLNGLKGSALSMGARTLAAQLRTAEETLDKTDPKEREQYGPPDASPPEFDGRSICCRNSSRSCHRSDPRPAHRPAKES